MAQNQEIPEDSLHATNPKTRESAFGQHVGLSSYPEPDVEPPLHPSLFGATLGCVVQHVTSQKPSFLQGRCVKDVP